MKTTVLLLCAFGLAVAAPINNNQQQDYAGLKAGVWGMESDQIGRLINLQMTTLLESKASLITSFSHPQGEQKVICGHKEEDPTKNKEKEKTFYLQIQKENWFKANELCRSNGTRLASISDEQENNRLKAMLNATSTTPESVWLSGSDLAIEGSFTWMSTGQPMTFSDWWLDNRHKETEEHCVHMRIHNEGYSWNDVNCYNKYPFVCESY